MSSCRSWSTSRAAWGWRTWTAARASTPRASCSSARCARRWRGRFVPELWTFGDALEHGRRRRACRDARLAATSPARCARCATATGNARSRRSSSCPMAATPGAQDAAASVDAAAAPVYAIGVGAPQRRIRSRSAGRLGGRDGGRRFIRRYQRRRRQPRRDRRHSIYACSRTGGRSIFAALSRLPTEVRYGRSSPSHRRGMPPPSTRWRSRRRRVSVCSRTTGVPCWWSRPGRRRAVLMIEGAPGFEHSFIKRALAADPGLELDSVVRKGRDTTGAATYFVQAAEARAPRLASGFPQEREALYDYDALILANVEADALSRPQLQMIADFVDHPRRRPACPGRKVVRPAGFRRDAARGRPPASADRSWRRRRPRLGATGHAICALR